MNLFFRVVKPRIRNGVRCLEIEWGKPGMYSLYTECLIHGV